jgi:hypothetical protein
MRGIMDRSGLGAATPYPVPGLESPRVLVMTRLFGHKVLRFLVLLWLLSGDISFDTRKL